jgi:hypothetical protein
MGLDFMAEKLRESAAQRDDFLMPPRLEYPALAHPWRNVVANHAEAHTLG